MVYPLGDPFRIHAAAILDAAGALESRWTDLDTLTYSALQSFSTAYRTLRDGRLGRA